MPKLRIDGVEVAAAEGETILSAAARAGIDIPHFCYHPAFPPEGSCRMCVVEVEGRPKLEPACATPVQDGLSVRTGSERVREARRAVLEFLLADHPLDCPVCDKAGECRLQDYHRDHGAAGAAFSEVKLRRSKLLPIGGGLVLDRERCVLCTRCVRFLRRITETHELGVFQRGDRCEIGLREERPVAAGYAGNLVDICPVGAISDGARRPSTRTWLLESRPSFCPLCGRGCRIWVDVRPASARDGRVRGIVRVRPRSDDPLHGGWICDEGRRRFPDLDSGRLAAVLQNKDGRRTELSWERALLWTGHKIRELADKGRADRIAVVLNTTLSNEELFLARDIFSRSLRAGSVGFLDPSPWLPDAFLRTSARTPNRTGARRLGFEVAPSDWRKIAEASELILLFAPPALDADAAAVVTAAWRPVRTKILLAARACAGIEAGADLVLPTALPAEKDGSWTGIDGAARSYAPALEAPGAAAPEWRILTRIAAEIGLGAVAGLGSFARVREACARELPLL